MQLVSNLQVLVGLDQVQCLVENGSHGAQSVPEVHHVSLPQHVTRDTGDARHRRQTSGEWLLSLVLLVGSWS